MSVSIIKSMGQVEEYVAIDDDFADLQKFCRYSQIQFMDESLIRLNVSDNGGIEFPDLIIKDDVFIFSDYVVQKIRSDIAGYVFMKPVEICCEIIGKKEKYWILVPPRIDCIDIDKSQLSYDWDFDLGIIPVLEYKKVVIDENSLGKFKMFKVLGIADNSMYFTNDLAEKIKKLKPEGIKFISR